MTWEKMSVYRDEEWGYEGKQNGNNLDNIRKVYCRSINAPYSLPKIYIYEHRNTKRFHLYGPNTKNIPLDSCPSFKTLEEAMAVGNLF